MRFHGYVAVVVRNKVNMAVTVFLFRKLGGCVLSNINPDSWYCTAFVARVSGFRWGGFFLSWYMIKLPRALKFSCFRGKKDTNLVAL